MRFHIPDGILICVDQDERMLTKCDVISNKQILEGKEDSFGIRLFAKEKIQRVKNRVIQNTTYFICFHLQPVIDLNHLISHLPAKCNN